MKNSIFVSTFLLFLVSSFSFASFPVVENCNSEQTVSVNEISFPVNSDIEKNDDKSFFESATNLLLGSGSSISWGALLAGFLLGPLGVLLVWIFGGDTNSAWKGWGVWIILVLLATLGV